jgi:RNA polymerase sigma-70 factor (ECF subfamily)
MEPGDNSTETWMPKAQWFTTTHWSVILTAGRSDSPQAEAALEKLCRTYWYPLYAYVRRQGFAADDAQDLTQEFFARLLEKNYLGSVERQKGKFRSFLLASLNHFLSNERDRARAAKRGGGKAPISLDELAAEDLFSQEPVSTLSPEKSFEKRWAITLLDQALARVREESESSGKGRLFDRLKVFLAGEAGPRDYAAVAPDLGMTPNAIAVTVHRMRNSYREMVRREIANTVSSPDEIEDEMRHLFSALAE